ncbi:MAG TPA: protein kinase, partial [Kofleriaceae bacterium]|nr:protein kinase [Kofleriaceae bacterium]
MIEYLDRIGLGSDAEQWLVRREGKLANAFVYFDEDRTWHDGVARHSTHWIGFEHPHVSPLLEITLAERLVIITGDERGPNLVQMAHELDDLQERETWALSELAGIAEGIAMMRWRVKDLVHRRADPLNMIVGADGHARLRAPISEISVGEHRGYLGRGKLIGGVGWMSPEQVLGLPLTPASDVFQLAGVAYAALALKRPFTGETDYEMLLAIREAAPPPLPPTTNGSIADVILRNLARDPAQRLRSVGEFAAALRPLV